MNGVAQTVRLLSLGSVESCHVKVVGLWPSCSVSVMVIGYMEWAIYCLLKVCKGYCSVFSSVNFLLYYTKRLDSS